MSPATIRNVVISLIAICIAVGVFGFMVYQTGVQGDRLTEQISTLEAQRSQEESYFKLQKTAEETKDERAKLESYFLLNESDSIDFLNNVETLAPAAGIELQTSNLLSVVDEEDKSQWIEVDFTFTGSRQRVRDFIKILEELPYVSRLTAIELSVTSQSQWQAKVTMRVRVLAYDS